MSEDRCRLPVAHSRSAHQVTRSLHPCKRRSFWTPSWLGDPLWFDTLQIRMFLNYLASFPSYDQKAAGLYSISSYCTGLTEFEHGFFPTRPTSAVELGKKHQRNITGSKWPHCPQCFYCQAFRIWENLWVLSTKWAEWVAILMNDSCLHQERKVRKDLYR